MVPKQAAWLPPPAPTTAAAVKLAMAASVTEYVAAAPSIAPTGMVTVPATKSAQKMLEK